MQCQLRAWRSGAFSKQLSTPTARSGSLRRCSSSAAPPLPPTPPPPPSGGSSGGRGGGDRRPSPASHWIRHVLQVAAGVLGAAGVAAAALPSVLSTQWGLQHAVEMLNTHLRPPGRVEVAGAQLSWLGDNELQCVKVYDSPRGGQILLHLNKVSTSSSLWKLLAGSSSYNLVIAKPWINTIYDARISDFKLVHFLEKVGLLRPGDAAEQGQAHAAAGDPPRQEGTGLQQGQQQQQEPGRLIRVLGRVNSKMEVNADVRMGRVNLVIADGLLLVPEEVRQCLGPRLHVTGALGDQQLREWAEEVGEDVAWADRAAAASGRPDRAASASAPSPCSAPPPPPPPAEVLRWPGRYRPGVLQVLSEHLRGEMRLWDAADHSLLHQPATASLDLTPALSRLALAATNPVLSNVVEVRGGGRLSGTFNPDGGRLPYQAATVEMEPVSLELGPAAMPLKLLGDLGLDARAGSADRRAAVAATAAAAALPSASAASDHTAAAGDVGVDGDVETRSLSAAAVSRMRVHFNRNGQVRTERVDMRLGGGGGGGGVQLAVWGGADLQRDQVQFTLGLSPAPLLAALGLGVEGLPPGYMLLVPVHGTVSEPRYDVAAAAVRLGQLGARQRVARLVERREAGRDGGVSGGQGRLGTLVAGLEALVSAVRPPEELMAAVDAVLLEDMAKVPPPLSQAG